MKTKTLRTAYWVATALFALLLVMDGVGGIGHAQAGIDGLAHLGYPVYLLTIMGTAKLLAAVAVLQTRFRTVKEWAFAGFAFTCVGAFWSRLALGDGLLMLSFPVIFLGLMCVPYALWKKRDQAEGRGRAGRGMEIGAAVAAPGLSRPV